MAFINFNCRENRCYRYGVVSQSINTYYHTEAHEELKLNQEHARLIKV